MFEGFSVGSGTSGVSDLPSGILLNSHILAGASFKTHKICNQWPKLATRMITEGTTFSSDKLTVRCEQQFRKMAQN